MTKEKMNNYIFYVSDFSELPSTGHFGKMDADKEIIRQLGKNLSNCKVMKYTEYDGRVLDAESVGIIFPSHTWGISLPVYSFLQNLKLAEHTYVYAVAIGESMSGDVDDTVLTRAKALQEFKRLFAKRGLGDDSNIYFRCIDYKRLSETTEDKLRDTISIKSRIEKIMEGLLFHNLDTVMAKKISSIKEAEREARKTLAMSSLQQGERQVSSSNRSAMTTTKLSTRPRMDNVFLDDSMLAGVRLCRVM